VAPLRPAEDAIHLDTTTLDFEEQVQFIVDRARLIFARD
jgi:cytidylate kinase